MARPEGTPWGLVAVGDRQVRDRLGELRIGLADQEPVVVDDRDVVTAVVVGVERADEPEDLRRLPAASALRIA